ncbi:MAG: efflux transporter outer membrane subunit [Planctomycetota bacterium]
MAHSSFLLPNLTSRRATQVAAALVVSAAAAGCKVGPDYEGPPVENVGVPDEFSAIDDPTFVPGEADLRVWWTVFDDPMLSDIIDAVAENNRDLRVAVAKVGEARARINIATAGRSPNVSLGGGSAATGNTDTGFASGLTSSLSAEASWEVDVFGRIARQIESAEADFAAPEADRRDVQVSLFAEAADRYLSVRRLQEQLRVAEANLETQNEILDLTRIRERDGLASRLDVVRAEQQVASNEAQLPPLRIDLNRNINTIALLVGEAPQNLPFDLETPQPLPVPPAEIVIGIPAELLRQRPDVRAAERRLAAQSARVGVAVSQLYPQFGLGGSINSDLAGSPLGFSLGPSVRWTLFDGGALESQVDVADAQLEQAALRYEQTVLRALEEVESAMTAFIEQRLRLEAVETSAASAQEAYDLATRLYRDDLIDFQALLSVEMELSTANAQVAEASGLSTQNLVALYKALGGGWDPDQLETADTEDTTDQDD